MKVIADIPLLEALWRLNDEIESRFPDPDAWQHGIAALGVFWGKPDDLACGDSGYIGTPTNVAGFAWTGGDGMCFGLLVSDGRVGTDSPVVVIAPTNFGNPNRILAENFRNFLRMGLQRGYFALEQFAYNPAEALHIYGTPDWQPTNKSHYGMGYVPDDRQAKILEFVAERLDLEPFSYTPAEFQTLQDRYMPLLEIRS